MSDRAESAVTRLLRDQTQRREQERNEAQTCARMAEERLAVLTSGNERLATEIARLRALLSPGPASAHSQTEQEMEALRDALLALLPEPHEKQA